MHQRNNQINQSVEQILQAPIIESPIAEMLPTIGTTFEHVSPFNVGQNTIHPIPPTDIVADNTQLMFKIQ